MVKFVAFSCFFVILMDVLVGFLVSDDLVRVLASWGSSVFLGWLLLYERDTLRASMGSLKLRIRKPKGDVEPTSFGNRDRELPANGSGGRSSESGGCEVGSVEVVGIPESYFFGKVGNRRDGEAEGSGDEDIAARFRGFAVSLIEHGCTFAFSQVYHGGRGRFFIQCKEQDRSKLARLVEGVDASLHSWFPDFDTKIRYGDVESSLGGGRHACGWVSNLPAPSRNPVKYIAEFFVQRRLTGSVVVVAEGSTSSLSSFVKRGRYGRLSAKAARQEQQSPIVGVHNKSTITSRSSWGAEKELKHLGTELERLGSKLQAKCWITLTCESSTSEEAEMDLDLVLRTFVGAFSFEEERHEMRFGKFPRRQAEVVYRATSKLSPRGRSTVLLPSDLALYFWLPEMDSVARVKRKGGFLAPTGEEVEGGEILLGGVLRHGCVSDVEARLTLGDLARHCLVVGSTGSGKTWTTLSIAMALHRLGVPFLVLDPVKKEYRCLVGAVPGLRVFTVGDEGVAPFRFNILEVPFGVKAQKHVDLVEDALCASIVMYPPAPYVLHMALNRTYREHGWDLTYGERGGAVSLRDLRRSVRDVVVEEGYEGEPRSTIIAALNTRFESLSVGGKGAALCSRVSMSPQELIANPTVVEFGEMGAQEDRAMVILMVLSSIYEYLQTLGPTSKPRCAIILEEAGSLFGNVGAKGGAEYDSKESRRKAIEVISRITAEIRSLGGMIIFVNQSAVGLPLEVTENTSTKIVHQVADDEDAEKVARMFGLNEEQKRALASLEVGRPVIKTPNVSHPFQVEVTPVTSYGVDPTKFVTDEELRRYMRATFYDANPQYLKASVMTPTEKTPTSAPSVTVSVVNGGRLAESIVARADFEAKFCKSVGRHHEGEGVKAVVKLLIAEASRYTRKRKEEETLAMEILNRANDKYCVNLRPEVRRRVNVLVKRELMADLQTAGGVRSS
ncbi:MAG: ATP-binding protein [Candidatus Atabeyarchaeum deiterrae]